jgi:hypothetical protein
MKLFAAGPQGIRKSQQPAFNGKEAHFLRNVSDADIFRPGDRARVGDHAKERAKEHTFSRAVRPDDR